MDLALMACASKLIKTFLPVNIVIMGIVLFYIYSVIRGVAEMKDKDTQYKLIAGVIISVIGIGVVTILIRMNGGWVILALPIAGLFVFASR